MNRFILILGLVFIFSSCSLKKVSNVNFSASPKNVKELTEKVNLASKIPEWLSLKGRINFINKEQEVALNINVKCKKDSIIWASISAPLGIELFRIQLSKDSIYFINRSNKTYFIKPISYVKEYLKTEISFSEINEMITASPRIIQDSYSFETDSNSYIIKSEKTQYKIDRAKHRILQGKISGNNSKLIFTFSEFKEISTYFFPHQLSLKVQSTEFFLATLKYSRVVFDQKQNIIFKIPNHYVEAK
ncbi:DUF4292 domain-containing protein [Flavobacteriales bacterium]|nr:DUF4292 domain-containing protein [Flavobacteriales bacterium]